MPESPLLFSVPAWGSCLLCSQEVEESNCPGVGAQEPTARLRQHSGRRRTVLAVSTRLRVCHSERSEESAFVIFGSELQILREVYPERTNCRFFAPLRMTSEGLRMEATFHPLGWAEAHRNSSTSRLQNRGNKARMYMKTKHKYKMSGSADRRLCGLRLLHSADRGPQTPRSTLHEIEGTKPECV